MNHGFIVLWRKFSQTSFFKDSYAVHLVVTLILKASYEPQKFIFNGQEQTLERGQILTGRKALAFETGIHESTIRHKLVLLQNIGFLTIKKTNRFSIITICNYSQYQNIKKENYHLLDQPSTNQVPTKDQPSTNQVPHTTIQPLNHSTIKPLNNKALCPPTLEEVRNYCQERHNNIDPEMFFNHYEANGWVQGKNKPIKKWKSAIITWEKRNEPNRKNQQDLRTNSERDRRKEQFDDITTIIT